MKKTNLIKKSIISLICFIITIFFNYFSATGKLNGITQKMMSDKYNTIITPAPLAFSIWSLIYLLTLTVILLAIFSKNNAYRDTLELIFPYFLGIFIFNIIWNILFIYEKIGLSTLAIIVYLFLLMKVNGIIKNYNWKNLFKITFGLHNGWLLVATIVNIAAFLKKINFEYPIDKGIFAIIVLLVITLVAIIISKYYRNPFILMPVAWAWFNIYRNHKIGTFRNLYPNVQFVTLAGTVIAIMSMIYIIYLVSLKEK